MAASASPPRIAGRIVRLPARALVRVAGPDWRAFLQGLLTQDVLTLEQGELRYGALLTPQGRLAFAFFLLGDGEAGVTLDVEFDRRDALVARLLPFRLRAKVSVEAAQGGVDAAWGAAPEGEGWIADPRTPALGWRRYRQDAPPAHADAHGDADAHADANAHADAEAYDAHRLALGVFEPARDAPDEKTYPLEANLDLLNGVDFKKGCFVGQETTSRMKRRAAVKSRIVPIVFDGPPPTPGAEVMAEALRAGEALSGVPGRALALLRLDRAAGCSLSVQGRAARIDAPPWLAVALPDLAEGTLAKAGD